MPPNTLADIKRLSETAFDRPLSDVEAEAFKGRLPTMAATIAMLRSFQADLGELPPTLQPAPLALQPLSGERGNG